MTASDSAKQQRQTIGLTVGLLMIATVGLAIAWAAIGQEVLTLPENRRDAAEIAARLPSLREERDSLINEIATLKAEAEDHRTKAERAAAVAKELPALQAEEARARGERDRLTKAVGALTSDRDTLQVAVGSLAARRTSIESEINALASRTEAERKRLDEVRQAVSEERTVLAQTKDAIASERQKQAQIETDLANVKRMLDSKRAELNGLTAEERRLLDQVVRLRGVRDELATGNQRESERLASLQSEAGTARIELASVQGQRDRVRDEFARVKAMSDTENARAEAISARVQHLAGLEAKVRQQIRAMIDELGEAGRIRDGSERPQ